MKVFFCLVLSICLFTSVLAFSDLPTPVGYWLFEEDVIDSSGNENHGEIIGKIDWVEGKFGLGLAFPGRADSYVLIEDSELLNPTEQLSVTCWANPADLSNEPRLVSKDGAIGRDWIGVQITPNWIEFGIWHPSGGRSLLDTKSGCEENKWQHFAGTFDGSTIIVYLDGEEIDRITAIGVGIKDTDEPLVFGTFRSALGQEPFNGVLDDVAIFDVALSASEVREIMERGLQRLAGINKSDKLITVWAVIKNGYSN